MSNYIRTKLPGGLYFFTVVTFGRQIWKEVEKKHPFKVEAICLLPDHLNCIWCLSPNDCDYPNVIIPSGGD